MSGWMNTRYIALLLAALSCVPHGAAMAQTSPQTLPGSADPARLDDRFRAPQSPDIDEIAPPSSTGIDDAIPFAENGFVLQAVRLDGVTAFEDGTFGPLISEYTGQTVDLDTLNHLAARITAAYRREGYFLSRAIVPEQEVTDGTVTIRVVEGRVNAITVDDPESLLDNDPLGILPGTIARIKSIVPLHGPTLERYALMLNQSYGIYVQSILTAPKQGSDMSAGGIDIALKVSKNPSAFSASYNNYGSRFIGPHQVTGEWVGGNILNAYDRLQIQASTSIPVREVQYGAFDYSLPITASGLTARTAFSYSNSRPGYTLKPLEVEGDSTFFETALSYPLILSRKMVLDVGAGLQIHNTATEFLDEELIDDKLRVLKFGTTLQIQDSWDGITTAAASVNQGVNIFNATETGTADLSRAEGRSDFTALQFDATRSQTLPHGFELSGDLSGQYTQMPLLSAQEFGYGGPRFGRAYDPSELTGDSGVAAGLELRYTDIDPVLNEKLRLVPFAFYDIGKVWNEDAGEESASAASAGMGLYYNAFDHVSGSLQLAYPLTKSVATPIMNGEDGPRVLFSVKTSF